MASKSDEDEQARIAASVVVPKKNIFLQKNDLIFTTDVHYREDCGFVAVDIQQWQGQFIGTFVRQYVCRVKYEAGYFAFKEGPLILKAINWVITQTGMEPAVIIVDGHGTAHPRNAGLACWVGVKSGYPAIGLAKAPLIAHDVMVAKKQGSKNPIIMDGNIVGYVLRIKQGVKPVYVSSGHRISQEQAVEVVYALRSKYRIIEPMRRADQEARRSAGIVGKQCGN